MSDGKICHAGIKIGETVKRQVIRITLFTAGCGPSYEERQAKKEEERKELIRKNEEKEKRFIGQFPQIAQKSVG